MLQLASSEVHLSPVTFVDATLGYAFAQQAGKQPQRTLLLVKQDDGYRLFAYDGHEYCCLGDKYDTYEVAKSAADEIIAFSIVMDEEDGIETRSSRDK